MATVYLSSTTKDLYEYREAVVAALHQLGHTIITREESDGRDDDALTNTYMFLSFCDLYVGIFAWRYGEIPAKANPEQLSLPVLEYRQADVFGLPRFIFLLDKNAPWPVSAQDNSTAHDIHDQRMRDFRKTLEREQAVRYFSWPEELATLVTTAVTLWEETQPENTADITPDETGDSGGERTTDVPPFEANGAQETAVPPTRLNRIFTPSLPFPYIPRPDELAQLRSAVLNYDHSHYRVPVALEGGAGTGKSVLATALCQDAQIQAAFPDGIFWVPMGDTPDDLLPPLRAIGRAFEDASTHYDTLESAHQRLAVLLHDKAVLLVLDNVCSQSQVELFHCDALNCRLLFTTRDAHLSLALGAQRVTLGSLSPPQAESLLREWALHDDPAFAAIAKRLGNLPLALKFVGMRLREGHDGNDWLAAFHHVSQLKLGRYAKTPGDNLELSFARSAQQLTEEDQVLYYALGIFPPEVPIPSSVVARLWQHLQPGLRQADCDDLLADLARRFLLERSVTEKTVSMREPLATYIRDQLGERYVSVTLALLTAYNPEAEPWPTVADDGYLYRYLTYHLHHAQQTDQLRQLLLDISWLEAKLLATNLPELLADFALIPEDTELQRVVSALALSAHILNADKTQLRSQIYGRLLAHELPQLSDTIEPTRAAPLWFRPLTPTLAAPGGPLVRTITGHPAVITTVAVSPDGRLAISGSADRTMKVWDLSGGTAFRTLSGHTATVTAVAFSPDGRQVISAADDCTLKVWDLQTGRELRSFTGHSDAVTAIALSPDGEHLLSASNDETVRIWDLRTGAEIHIFTGHREPVTVVAVPSHGRQVLSAAGDGTLTVWGMRSHLELFSLVGHSDVVTAIATTPNGGVAVSASSDNTLKVWDLDNGTELHTLTGHTTAVTTVAVTPDGHYAVSGSGDRTIKVWDLLSGKELHSFLGHTNWITAVAITPDGKSAISASNDQTLRVWNLEGDATLVAPLAHQSSITAVAITPSGRSVISASSDHTLTVWERDTRKKRRTLRGHTDSVTAVAVTRDGRQVVSASSDHTLKIWDLLTGLELYSLHGHTHWVTSVATTADGEYIVSGSGDGEIKVWDLNNGTELRSLMGHTNWVTAVAVSPNSRLIISASTDRKVKVWELKSGRELLTLTGHASAVTAVAAMPDGKRIISASADTTLKIWDLSSGHLLGTLTGHTGEVRAVAVSPDGRYAISSADDETIRAWDLSDGKLVASIGVDAPVRACRIVPTTKTRTIVAGDQFGRLHFLRLETQAVMADTGAKVSPTSQLAAPGKKLTPGQKNKLSKSTLHGHLAGDRGKATRGINKNRTRV